MGYNEFVQKYIFSFVFKTCYFFFVAPIGLLVLDGDPSAVTSDSDRAVFSRYCFFYVGSLLSSLVLLFIV